MDFELFAAYCAAALLFGIGIAHSYLGERYILIRLFRRELPELFGGVEFTRNTLRFAWHLTTIAWWGFAWLILAVGKGGIEPQAALIIAWVFGVHGLVALLASKGRHLSWIVFFLVMICALYLAF